MWFYDSIYFIAYGLFLTGAAMCLRGYSPAASLWIMATGVLLDFFGAVLPYPGLKSLAIAITGNMPIIMGITLDVVVWIFFLGALFVRLLQHKQAIFFRLITIIKIVWFADLMLFFHGVYNQALRA